MTVSLDPRSGLTLEALWDRLEELEELHWAGERPRNAPRRGIAKYSTDTGEPTSSAPNQPWYDERGRYTLIGAPRAVAAGVSGTRLAWSEDVLPAIWDLYSPIRPAPEFGHIREVFGRKLQVVRWPRGEAGAVQRMPVLYQWLASQSTQSDSNHPGKFFAYEELKVVSVPGGEIIVHPRGLTIIDDWTAVNIDDASILTFAEHLARVVGGYEKVLGGTELKTLVEEELASLKKPQEMGFQALSRLRARAVGLRARVIELSARESTLKPIAGEHEIRAAIEFAWGLPQTRRELWDLLARVDELLTQSQELAERKRMYWTTSILSTAGVFVVVKEIVAVIQDNLTMNQFEMALPVWRQIGIAEKDKFSYEILKLQADIASYFDRLGFFLLVGIFLLGIFLAARRYFQKGKGSKVATNGDQN